MRALGGANLCVAQTKDLGNSRPCVSDNAAGRVSQDRDVLRVVLPAIDRSSSIYGGGARGLVALWKELLVTPTIKRYVSLSYSSMWRSFIQNVPN